MSYFYKSPCFLVKERSVISCFVVFNKDLDKEECLFRVMLYSYRIYSSMRTPPLIVDLHVLKQKMDLLDTLSDIEIAIGVLNDQTIHQDH